MRLCLILSLPLASCDQLLRPANCDRSCLSGCFCRVPYVLREQSPHASCILPQHCPPTANTTDSILTLRTPPSNEEESTTRSRSHEKRCAEPNKEFVSCASSCPLGCDRLESQQCTPCVSGCFCKNGFVFNNSSDWRNSPCVPIAECGGGGGKALQPIQPVNVKAGGASRSPSVSNATCPTNPTDRNGRSCDSDFECGFHQKCCPYQSQLAGNGTNPIHKCTCLDPNAVWMECGTMCPGLSTCHQPFAHLLT